MTQQHRYPVGADADMNLNPPCDVCRQPVDLATPAEHYQFERRRARSWRRLCWPLRPWNWCCAHKRCWDMSESVARNYYSDQVRNIFQFYYLEERAVNNHPRMVASPVSQHRYPVSAAVEWANDDGFWRGGVLEHVGRSALGTPIYHVWLFEEGSRTQPVAALEISLRPGDPD